MPRSRKDSWLRDELVLALDLYVRRGRNPPASDVAELSSFLRALPIEPQLAEEPAFRGVGSVTLKLANFAALDPASGIAGMPRGGRGDREAWDEFATDPRHLALVAGAIRANVGAIRPGAADQDEDGIADAAEGRVLTRVHRSRERNAKLAAARKALAMKRLGRLACEACGFDFFSTYGPRGDGYIECHHVTPLHQLAPGTRTRLEDLALVCANCHRMIHRSAVWLSVAELRSLIAEHQAPNALQRVTGRPSRAFAPAGEDERQQQLRS